MNGDGTLAGSIMKALDMAVLLRIEPKKYILRGEKPDFYIQFFSGAADGPLAAPWLHSPMMEFFLEEAERFFANNTSGILSSGHWQEDGKTDDDSSFQALAVITDDNARCIVIRLLHEEFMERAAILRKARAQLLKSRSLARTLETFREKSRIDSLTGLFNRATLMETMHIEMDRSNQTGEPLSLLMLDIDDFKLVNDTYGHVTGDAVLRTVADVMASCMRRDDVVARYGGEEFAIVVPNCTCESAVKIGEKIRSRVELTVVEGQPSTTISIGCAALMQGDTDKIFIERADRALYEAKRAGKNKVRCGLCHLS